MSDSNTNLPEEKAKTFTGKMKETWGKITSLGQKKDACPDEIVEFQVDALEIKNQKLPGYVVLGIWIPFFILLLALIWSCLAEVDVVVQSNGKLVTDLPTIVMKPLERSVIKKINVRLGEIVKKDQILITFDPEFNKAEAERLNNEITALQAQLSRLIAEFKGEKFVGTSERFSQWQAAIYKQRQGYYREKMNYYTEALKQIDASKKSKKDTLRKQKERLQQVFVLENMYKGLFEKKAASLKDLIQMSITRMELEANVDTLANDLLELEHRRGTTLAEQNSFIQEWRNNLSEELIKVRRDLTSNQKQYDKERQLLEYVYLKAPCDAVVHEIAAFSPGSAVREAEALITLIPLVGRVEVEAEIRPEDIAKVKLGAESRIKLTAYPYQKHGTLNGVVRNISNDTLERSVGGATFKYFRARVSVSGKLRAVKGNFRLIPGMETQCEIKCGRRKVIEYVFYPLIKALDETAREP